MVFHYLAGYNYSIIIVLNWSSFRFEKDRQTIDIFKFSLFSNRSEDLILHQMFISSTRSITPVSP